MKTLIVYSSLTGNTKSVAHAIAEACPSPEVYAIDEAPPHEEYDLIAIGYWVIRGKPDPKSLSYMEKVKGKNVGLFGTLAAYPDSNHAQNCMAEAEKRMSGNRVLGQFLCQGRLDPKRMEAKAKSANSKHPMTEERRIRLEEAKKHPNQNDFDAARAVFADIVSKL